MGKYISDKSKMKFSSIDSLKRLQEILNEADKGISEKSRIIIISSMSDVLAGALGMGSGGAISFAMLYFGGAVTGLSAAGITSGLAAAGALVHGGMAAGIGVLAAPAVVLSVAGVSIASHMRNKKLRELKELCYKEALAKQNAIIKELREEANMDKERIDYLVTINKFLEAAIRDLKYDLGEN